MARRGAVRQLDIWMNGVRVGAWLRERAGERLTYAEEWVQSPQGRPLSLSLPFTPGNRPYQGPLVGSYFDNLLPDSAAIRRRLAQRYRTEGEAPFELLTALGRDCVGAVQLLPEGEQPGDVATIQAHPMSEAAIAQLLRSTLSSEPLGRDSEAGEDLRLSIAGAQEKTALLWHGGQWRLPRGSTPTTHIFKLPMGLVGGMQADMRTSVENEWLCAQLVAGFGLPIAQCEIAHFEDQKVLVVERFDRRLAPTGEGIVRLPQEDLCQATGLPPHLKYQADGGPGVADIMDVLLGSEQAEQDRRNFFKAQLVFWLLAAIDGHAKNFSIAHLPGSRYQATPLYDVLSAHPITGRGARQIAPQKLKLAMAVKGKGGDNLYLVSKIQRRHWNAMATRFGLDGEALVAEVLAQTSSAIEMVLAKLPAGFPSGLAEAIFDGMQQQANRLAAMPVD
ncbi:type II toxin-antitoxin system HipA family toxin [Chitinimonas sp.]|uniref:type II toxin-antitoxin system HipA family toxin n=1 Tax=Chitinimonas sp. TaxID=1934313 RepID=UPI002F950BD5